MRIVLLAAVMLGTASATAEEYLWTISASDTDPYVNTGPPAGGVTTLHVWLACSTMGMGAVEFSFGGDAWITPLAFTPGVGFFVGNPPSCVIGAAGCPSGPVRVGELLVLEGGGPGGRVCLIPCPGQELAYTYDCDSDPQIHPNAWIGYASDGSPPCSQGSCGPVSVEETSWGGVKGSYR